MSKCVLENGCIKGGLQMILKTSDDMELYYETHGDLNNPSILLIHGIGADHKMFSPQIEKYSKEGYFVIAPDMRGHGKSSKVSTLKLSDWTRDIKELMDHLNISKTILLGVSMGGVIVQKFVCEFPEKVNKLIISDSFGEIKTITEKVISFAQIIGFNIFKVLPQKTAANLVASTYKEISKEAEEYFEDISLKTDFTQLLLARKAINKIDILDDLKKIEVSTLVLVGDKIKLMVGITNKIAQSIKNSHFRVIKDSLDPSNLVAPDKFDKEVLDFLLENNYRR